MRGAILPAENENELHFWKGGSPSQSARVQTGSYCGATLKGPLSVGGPGQTPKIGVDDDKGRFPFLAWVKSRGEELEDAHQASFGDAMSLVIESSINDLVQ